MRLRCKFHRPQEFFKSWVGAQAVEGRVNFELRHQVVVSLVRQPELFDGLVARARSRQNLGPNILASPL